MSERESRSEKVKRIFRRFDVNEDGRLSREEMAALVAAVNPSFNFSDEQISAILDEIFRVYGDFIHGEKGLTYDGLMLTYDDGAGDVVRDYDALQNQRSFDEDEGIVSMAAEAEAFTSSIVEEKALSETQKKQRATAYAEAPNHGIAFNETWKIVEELEKSVRQLKKTNQEAKGGKKLKGLRNNPDANSDAGWSSELGPSSELSKKRVVWEESGHIFSVFMKELEALRNRADEADSREEAFDSHMAIGSVLYSHELFKEALFSFKCACELQPTDIRPRFRAGNCLYLHGKYKEAKEEFLLALQAAEASGNQWGDLLPQINVNLGISLEGEGMVLSACEYYMEAAILCPTHFRALKLLGSALFGIGENRAAVKALEEAIFLKPDYADAHCDLASALHAMGDGERAIEVFQKAIDLKPCHVDALYNLGGLYLDLGRFKRASEIYTRVLALWPNHWQAQINKAVSLLGAGEDEEAMKALKEALKMTNRVELHDTMLQMKEVKRKKKVKKANGSYGEGSFIVVELEKFRIVGEGTTLRRDLANALEIRAFQRASRLRSCDVELLKKIMTENNVQESCSKTDLSEKSISKANLEKIIRRLLNSLKPDRFMGAVKAINVRILSVLDGTCSGMVDLGIFFALLAPICSGTMEKRKRVAFDSLLWRLVNEDGSAQIRKSDATRYFELLRQIYTPNHRVVTIVDISDLHEQASDVPFVLFSEFLDMFENPDSGFGTFMTTLLKLENGDRNRHDNRVCSVCHSLIIGSRFKEMKSNFSLCNQCYSEGKVPPVYSKQEQYRFKEYGSESDARRDKWRCFRSSSIVG